MLAEAQFAADYVRAHKHRILPSREMTLLALQAKAGDIEAQNEVILHCLRMVDQRVSICTHNSVYAQDLEIHAELRATAVLGFPNALKNFDPSKGVFVAYLRDWLDEQIEDEMGRLKRSISFSGNARKDLGRVYRARTALTKEGADEPSEPDIAKRARLRLDRVQTLLGADQPLVALSTPAEALGDEESEGEGWVQPAADHTPESLYEQAELENKLEAVLDEVLPWRERKILRACFGVGGQPKLTLAEAGALVGVKRKRAEQLRDRGLKLLRDSDRRELLRALLEGAS